MPAKLTPEERIGRGRAALDKLRKSIQDVDATTGQKRGQAYRRANSQGLAVNNALAENFCSSEAAILRLALKQMVEQRQILPAEAGELVPGLRV